MRDALPESKTALLPTPQSYSILGTMPEQAFDDATRLAALLCGAPIGLVSIIDGDRQRFKSTKGLDISAIACDMGFCAQAVLNPQEVLVVPDARRDECFAADSLVTGPLGIRFFAGAPLLAPNGEVVGTLCVMGSEPCALSEDQKEGLRALSRQFMAQAELKRQCIEVVDNLAYRIQIEHVLRESEERFKAFMNNSPIVAFLKDQDGYFSYINETFLKRFELQREAVIGHSDAELWPEAAPVLREHDLQVLAGTETVSLIETVLTPDGQSQYWQVWKFPLQRGGGSGRYLAGVALDITENKRYEQQLEQYQEQLELALSEVQTSSVTDGLTKLHNRHAFNKKLDDEFDRSQRYNLPLSLLMIDVDKFKSFNDTFGHPAGDEVLQTVSRLLEEKARTSDFVARYGGEEFVIVLPNTGREGAFILAERFRRAVHLMPWRKRGVTVSIGVASFTPLMSDGAALVDAADKALYQAKRSGRNRVAQANRIL